MSSKLRHALRPHPIVLRNASFGRLWISQLQSDIGTWLMVIAVPLFVFHLTGSPAGTSIALISEAAPALFVAPFAGLLADRCDRRLVMAGSDALRAACVLSMLAVTAERQVWLIYAATFAENTFAQFFDPACGAIVPAIVGRGGELDEANGWSTASAGLVRLAGGPLGGVLYSALGFHALVLGDSGTYLVSALLVLSLPRSRPVVASLTSGRPDCRAGLDRAGRPPRAGWPGQAGPRGRAGRPGRLGRQGKSRVLTELAAGVRFLVSHRVVGFLVAANTLFLFANAALTVALVPLAVQLLHQGPRDVGLMMAALGVGYLAGAYPGRRVSATGSFRLPIVMCLIAADGAFAGFFNSRDLPMALVFIALIGVFGSGLLLLVNVQIQRQSPDQVLGRTRSAIGAIQMLAAVIGAALGGVLAARVGVVAMADLALVPVAAAAVLAWFTLPATIEGAGQPSPQSAPHPCPE
ncbi:MAG TPA: MFS transporter [Streptosporangiaceae bacterium]|nr:MFS transporter [Streptosporangiaceae bacterium]